MNFLQEYYNRYRQAGGDHISYKIVNDLDDTVADTLLQAYDKEFPAPVPEEIQRQFKEGLRGETQEAQARDDLEWLTGTGRYGQ